MEAQIQPWRHKSRPGGTRPRIFTAHKRSPISEMRSLSTFDCHPLARAPWKSNFEALPRRPEKPALEGYFEPFLVKLSLGDLSEVWWSFFMRFPVSCAPGLAFLPLPCEAQANFTSPTTQHYAFLHCAGPRIREGGMRSQVSEMRGLVDLPLSRPGPGPLEIQFRRPSKKT